MTDLKGKVAIVTGSGNGIGRATVKKIAESGASVTVSDVLPEDGERMSKRSNPLAERRSLFVPMSHKRRM